MKHLFKEAHRMTREMIEKYNDVDYSVQFTLCLNYLLDAEKEKVAELRQRSADRPERKSWMSWGLSRKQVGVFYANYKNGNLDLSDDVITYLYDYVADKKYYKNSLRDDEFGRLRFALELVFEKCYHAASKEINLVYRHYN